MSYLPKRDLGVLALAKSAEFELEGPPAPDALIQPHIDQASHDALKLGLRAAASLGLGSYWLYHNMKRQQAPAVKPKTRKKHASVSVIDSIDQLQKEAGDWLDSAAEGSRRFWGNGSQMVTGAIGAGLGPVAYGGSKLLQNEVGANNSPAWNAFNNSTADMINASGRDFGQGFKNLVTGRPVQESHATQWAQPIADNARQQGDTWMANSVEAGNAARPELGKAIMSAGMVGAVPGAASAVPGVATSLTKDLLNTGKMIGLSGAITYGHSKIWPSEQTSVGREESTLGDMSDTTPRINDDSPDVESETVGPPPIPEEEPQLPMAPDGPEQPPAAAAAAIPSPTPTNTPTVPPQQPTQATPAPATTPPASTTQPPPQANSQGAGWDWESIKPWAIGAGIGLPLLSILMGGGGGGRDGGGSNILPLLLLLAGGGLAYSQMPASQNAGGMKVDPNDQDALMEAAIQASREGIDPAQQRAAQDALLQSQGGMTSMLGGLKRWFGSLSEEQPGAYSRQMFRNHAIDHMAKQIPGPMPMEQKREIAQQAFEKSLQAWKPKQRAL